MTARMRLSSSVVSVLLGGAVLLGVTGCGAVEPDESEITFAKVSGDVVAGQGEDVPMNLVVAAPSHDPVWSGLSELSVVNDAGQGGDLVFGPGTVELHPGTEHDGVRVGSFTVQVPSRMDAFEVSSVKVAVEGGSRSRTYAIGQWKLTRTDAEGSLTAVGDYPASLPGCGEISIDLEDQAGSLVDDIVDVATQAPGVVVTDFDVRTASAGVSRVTFTLECDSRELVTFTPRITVERDGRQREHALQTILVGYQHITQQDVQRILEG